jgi:TonB family protein
LKSLRTILAALLIPTFGSVAVAQAVQADPPATQAAWHRRADDAERQPAVPEAGHSYLNLLRDRVAKYLPTQGEDSVRLTVSYVVGLRRNGQLVSVQIIRRSGNDRIDMAGVSAIRRASPMPPVPADFPGDPVLYFTANLSIWSF